MNFLMQPLQKNGSEAAFLKRSHRAKKRGYSPIWPIAAFFRPRFDLENPRSQSLKWVSKQLLLLMWRVTVEIGDGAWGEGWGWGWDRRWRVRRGLRSERWRVTVEIGDGGWGEGFGSGMEGEAKVFDRRWRVTVTASDRRDGGWSGSSEGDRVQNVSEEKKKTKALQQDQPKKISPMAVCIKRGLRPAQKKREKMSKKHGLRPGLRPRV